MEKGEYFAPAASSVALHIHRDDIRIKAEVREVLYSENNCYQGQTYMYAAHCSNIKRWNVSQSRSAWMSKAKGEGYSIILLIEK